jgi:hypothetical protein
MQSPELALCGRAITVAATSAARRRPQSSGTGYPTVWADMYFCVPFVPAVPKECAIRNPRLAVGSRGSAEKLGRFYASCVFLPPRIPCIRIGTGGL